MRSILLNYSTILFCLLFIHTISAQNGDPSEDVPITSLGTIHNDGNGALVPNEFCLSDNDDLTVRTNIILGGLSIQGDAPDFYGVIPANFPEMYIEYTIDNVVYPPSQVGNFDLIELPNGYPAYSYIAQSPTVNFTDECKDVTEEAPYIYTTVSFRLVTPNGNDWDTYPACDYSQTGEMFSCQVYDFAPWCENVTSGGSGTAEEPSPNCYDEWFSGEFSAYLYCDCGEEANRYDNIDSDESSFAIDKSAELIMRNVLESEVKVYPNPMENVLLIETFDSNISKIEVYDASGKMIIHNVYMGNELRNVRLNTANLKHGLYVVRTTTNKGIIASKVLK